jgi:predicted Rossmann fold flavoprotein
MAAEYGVKIKTQQEVDALTHTNGKWAITTSKDETLTADIVFIATGSALRMWDILRRMGYETAEPVPSLFTFNIKDERINGLQGIAAERVTVKIQDTKLQESGPLLITHWGMSGPAILKLSAWGARILKEKQYKFDISVNWTGDLSLPQTIEKIKEHKMNASKKAILNNPLFKLPSRLWERLCKQAQIKATVWADLSNKELQELATALCQSVFAVTGKSTFKDEFVTCGGVELHQIDLKTFQSKLHPNLFFAGEVLNIDAITGGFNFQAAWTGAWIAAQNV